MIEELDVSASLGAGRSVMLSMSDVPDISAEDAQQIVEMFSKELAESITGEGKTLLLEETHQDLLKVGDTDLPPTFSFLEDDMTTDTTS